MNLLGAPKEQQHLRGGIIEDWFAPDLTSNRRKGLGGWSRQELVDYLKTGRNAHANAAGPMGEVVAKSTADMTDADLGDIAAYLSDRPPSPPTPAAHADSEIMRRGEAIFVDNCSACHQMQGQGTPGLFPPLRDHAGLQQTIPTTTIRVVLTGVQSTPTRARPTGVSMPAYAWKLSDEEVAAVVTYTRNAWGNSAPAVSAVDVATLRVKLVTDGSGSAKAPGPNTMARPGPATLAPPGSDSRDNATPHAGQPAAEPR
jgi:mono/diheme cytochrome c family protein